MSDRRIPRLLALVLLLAAPWAARAGQPLNYVATGLAGDGQIKDFEDIRFQEANTSEDGTVFAAGVHRGPMTFQGRTLPAIAANTANPGIFLARRGVGGTWDYLVELYAPFPAALSAADNAATVGADIVVRDIKVADGYAYVAATIYPDRKTLDKPGRQGWVAKVNTTNGVIAWQRFILGYDVSVSSVAVDSFGQVSVGGAVGNWNGTTQIDARLMTTNSAAQLTSFGTLQNTKVQHTDGYVLQLTAAGAYRWVMRSGNQLSQTREEVVALETDALDQIHLLMNADATKNDPLVVLAHSTLAGGLGYRTNSIGCAPLAPAAPDTCVGSGTVVAGKLTSSGGWMASFTLDPDAHLAPAYLPAGGELVVTGTDLRRFDGKVFVAGSYVYNPSFYKIRGGFILRLADDYTPDNQVVHFRPGGDLADAYAARMRVAGGQLLVAGKMPASLNQYTVDISATSLGKPGMEVNGMLPSYFVAAFNSQLAVQWMTSTAEPGSRPPPRTFSGSMLAYSGATRQVLWGGGFATDSLRRLALGEGNDIQVLDNDVSTTDLPVSWGWMVALSEQGHYLAQNVLTVASDYGPVTVNGMDFGRSGSYLRGTLLTVAVPQAVYEANKLTRHSNQGFTLNQEIVAGSANTYTFALDSDVTLNFRWLTEHQLTVASQHANAGLPGDAEPGNPDPGIGIHWIADGTAVNPRIQGIIPDPSDVDSRYYVNQITVTNVATGTYSYVTPVESPAPPQIVMTGAASIAYGWKKQHAVTVSDNTLSAFGYALSRQTDNGGNVQQFFTGGGRFWMDRGSRIELASRAVDPASRRVLVGWQAASPVAGGYFPSSVFSSSNPPDAPQLSPTLSSATLGGQSYWMKVIPQLNQAVGIMWDYDPQVTKLYAAVGTDFFPTSLGIPVKPPAEVSTLVDTPGVGTADAFVWDARRGVGVAIRPGVFKVTWLPASGTENVVTLLYAGFDGDARQDGTGIFANPVKYRHVALTPPVDLDPDPKDARYFEQLLWHQGGAHVDSGRFSSDYGTRAVLLFRTNVVAARTVRNPAEEIVQVRVVDSRDMRSTNDWTGVGNLMRTNTASQVVGRPITSLLHTGVLHSGHVYHEVANYDANLHDRASATGPIIPVNLRQGTLDPASNRELVIVWYERKDGMEWPYQPVWHPVFDWPNAGNVFDGDLRRIVIASRLGSEGLSASGAVQPSFDPDRYANVRIYNQPDPSKPGYNPNEEHARIFPSLLAGQSGRSVPAAFALRNDLNVSKALIGPLGLPPTAYTSDPYVLVEYMDKQSNTPGMAVYAVQMQDLAVADARLDGLPGTAGRSYALNYAMKAGERIQPPYPLNLVAGLFPCVNTTPGVPFTPSSNLPNGTFYRDVAAQRGWHVDHKGAGWAVSGGSAFDACYFYPLQPDFYYPFALDPGTQPDAAGDCIPWLPAFDPTNPTTPRKGVFDADPVVRTQPVAVRFDTAWPDNLPVLKAGETLTFAGGEYHADHPDVPGLPGIVGFSAARVVYDSSNASMVPLAPAAASRQFSARVIAPLLQRAVSLPVSSLPDALKPGAPGVEVNGDEWRFGQLPPSLRKRVFFKPLAKILASDPPGVLGIRGYLDDKTLGDPALTGTPSPVYVLEPNILTAPEREKLVGLSSTNKPWTDAARALYTVSRNPSSLPGGDLWDLGLETADASGNVRNASMLGSGLALVSNPGLLAPGTPAAPLHVTLAENDDATLGDAPVSMHVIQVSPADLYRGAIKTILPPNVFDEKITLRHTADFGGYLDEVAFSWWYHEEDGTVRPGDVPPGPTATSPAWNPVGDASGTVGQNQIDLNGNPVLLLADNLFYARYRHAKALPAVASSWSDWAGAANSSTQDLNADGRPDFRPQLAMGWVKRVLDGINPYEARVRDFARNDSPATGASVVRSLGGPFTGPVALNASKDVVENVGLIELYETVLQRARDMSILAAQPANSPGIQAALMLASTRLSLFYSILGNEAWDDALDPTIGYGKAAVDAGALNSAHFCFENQVPGLLDEELSLLRGTDESLGRPVFNRLFWNFTKGQGEVAYALNYQVKDADGDGVIDESDAARLHPQGHGDAWGHYLSALRKHYDLLRTPGFSWQRRREYYNLLDVVVGVDYLDEAQFARSAAARAQVGAEIVDLTRRSRYTDSPAAPVLGYTDTDANRAWGVTEWARRAGQAAVFDWIVANALLPAVDPDPTHEGIARIDRATVRDVDGIAAQLGAIQASMDASDTGLNPLGLDPGVVPFDIDPTHIDVGSTAQVGRQAVQGLSHFEQIFERAFEALRNAAAAQGTANDDKARLRQVAQSADDLRLRAAAQDLEYRNRLIDIFGMPYDGQVGPGKAYPSGYNGPDLNLFMYVDINAVSPSTVPLADTDTYFDEYVSFYSLANDVPTRFRADIKSHFLDDISLDGNTAVELLGDDLVHLKLPARASDYTLVAPDSWGQRPAVGRLQSIVSEMNQTEADLNLAVGDYDFLIKQLRDKVSLFRMRATISDEILGIDEARYDQRIAMNTAIIAAEATATTVRRLGELQRGLLEAYDKGLPLVVGVAFDPSSVARGVINGVGAVINGLAEITADGLDVAVTGLEQSKEIIDLRDEIAVSEKEFGFELQGMLQDIEELLVNEGVTRIRLFSLREQYRSQLERYRSTLQEGVRLLEERRQANAAIAAETQENRYHDMLFRDARHESVQRLRSLQDLAQRYAYLAAKAYDYESNLGPGDRASARPLLDAVVRARTIGNVGDNSPVAGSGLAGVLARMMDTFRSIEGRLGFNNFQYDHTSFSIRSERARLRLDPTGSNAQDWVDYLASCQVDDLWARVPEFRRFCRPFAPPGQAEPALVLRFSTTIRAGRNFFGNPLAGGDASYDPTLFATKIRASGVRIEGYPADTLARTPGVYLVPVGMDYMTIPDSPTLDVRGWNVVDQSIPSPLAVSAADLSRPDWLAGTDSLTGIAGAIRRHSSVRASVSPNPGDDNAFNSTRLIGRSVWNDQWILIVPGRALHADPAEGLRRFIQSVTDLRLNFETYGYSGN